MWVQSPLFSQAFGVHVQTGEHRRLVRGGLRSPSGGSTSISVRSAKTPTIFVGAGGGFRGAFRGRVWGANLKMAPPLRALSRPPCLWGSVAQNGRPKNSCKIRAVFMHALMRFFMRVLMRFFMHVFMRQFSDPPVEGMGVSLGRGTSCARFATFKLSQSHRQRAHVVLVESVEASL